MSGSQIGQSGVERIYNRTLFGKDGARQVLVDSMGQEVGRLEEIDSVIGGEIQLTLDLDLQSIAEKALEDKVGAIVAMDPRNGEILAMASAPSFDPNDFSTRISEEKWAELIESSGPSDAEPGYPEQLFARFHIQADHGGRRS